MIPKILFQTSKFKMDRKFTINNDWQYLHFDDHDIMDFFDSNPIEGFEDIKEIFHNIPLGEHKADLFRYYFLYVNGGVFIDSDLDLKNSLDEYVNEYDFITCQSGAESDCYFNGIIGACANNKIILDLLSDVCDTVRSGMTYDYLFFCRNLKTVILSKKYDCKIKLFHEMMFHNHQYNVIFDTTGLTKLIGLHYQHLGYVPTGPETRIEKIFCAYREILNRQPELQGAVDYFNCSLTIGDIRKDMLSSQEYRALKKNNSKSFTDVYLNCMWSNAPAPDIYDSGVGSSCNLLVEDYTTALENYFSKFDQKLNVLDIGCGNFLVGSKIRHIFNRYNAIDTVEHVIVNNKKLYSDLDVEFETLDAEIDDLPKSEVVVVRQVFQHLSNRAIQNILNKLTDCKYLIISEHLPAGDFLPNFDIHSGAYTRYPHNSGVVLHEMPFQFKYVTKKQLCKTDITYGGVLSTMVYEL